MAGRQDIVGDLSTSRLRSSRSRSRDGVLIQGEALPLLYRACLALIARRSRDGLAASPLLQQARTTFYRACMSAQRRKGAAYHLAESRCNGQGRLANPKTAKTSARCAA